MRVVGRFPIVSILVLGARTSSISVVGYSRGVVSTSRLHRKSDSVVEAGRPATEGDWISRVTIGEKTKETQRESSQTKTSLRSNQDATPYLAQRGVVLGFQVSIRGTKAGRAHLNHREPALSRKWVGLRL